MEVYIKIILLISLFIIPFAFATDINGASYSSPAETSSDTYQSPQEAFNAEPTLDGFRDLGYRPQDFAKLDSDDQFTYISSLGEGMYRSGNIGQNNRISANHFFSENPDRIDDAPGSFNGYLLAEGINLHDNPSTSEKDGISGEIDSFSNNMDIVVGDTSFNLAEFDSENGRLAAYSLEIKDGQVFVYPPDSDNPVEISGDLSTIGQPESRFAMEEGSIDGTEIEDGRRILIAEGEEGTVIEGEFSRVGDNVLTDPESEETQVAHAILLETEDGERVLEMDGGSLYGLEKGIALRGDIDVPDMEALEGQIARVREGDQLNINGVDIDNTLPFGVLPNINPDKVIIDMPERGYFRLGDTDAEGADDIQVAQNLLVRAGHLSEADFNDERGTYGDATEAAVRAFQATHQAETGENLGSSTTGKPDGLFGGLSRGALMAQNFPLFPERQEVDIVFGRGDTDNGNFIRLASGEIEAGGFVEFAYPSDIIRESDTGLEPLPPITPDEPLVNLPSRNYLRAGDTDAEGADDIAIVQNLLVRSGHLDSDSYEKGVYDDATVEAVRTFQTANQLKPDTFTGPLTLAQLQSNAYPLAPSDALRYEREIEVQTQGGRVLIAESSGGVDFDVQGDAIVRVGGNELRSDGEHLLRNTGTAIAARVDRDPDEQAQVALSVDVEDENGETTAGFEQEEPSALDSYLTLARIYGGLALAGVRIEANELMAEATAAGEQISETGSDIWSSLFGGVAYAADIEGGGKFDNSDSPLRIERTGGEFAHLAPSEDADDIGSVIARTAIADFEAQQEQAVESGIGLGTFFGQTKGEFTQMMKSNGLSIHDDADVMRGVAFFDMTKNLGYSEERALRVITSSGIDFSDPNEVVDHLRLVRTAQGLPHSKDMGYIEEVSRGLGIGIGSLFSGSGSSESLIPNPIDYDVSAPKPTDCITCQLDLYEKAFDAANREAEYQRLRSVSNANQAMGSYIARHMVNNEGWQTVFAAPDAENPKWTRDYFEVRHREDPLVPIVDYESSIDSNLGRGRYGALGIDIDALMVDYNPSERQAISRDENDETVYRDVDPGSITPRDTSVFDSLQNNPTVNGGFIVARDGGHTASLVRDVDGRLKVYESHYNKDPFIEDKWDFVNEMTPLEEWDWGEFLIVLPPDADLSAIRGSS
ncbi:MAG: peptidoglycan-binding domain-containing protein [Candidatus Woesearchaeota archaeon]